MREYIALCLLRGWLCSELKDFINYGGVGNTLALTLLKIIFILTMINITGDISYPIIETVKNIAVILMLCSWKNSSTSEEYHN
jgi:hypothetical protein